MVTHPKVCFLGGMGGRSLVVSQCRKMGFLRNFKKLFFWWCWMGWLQKGGGCIIIIIIPFMIW
jgi:hypothetical protein